jgi:hypothetical protein
VHAAGKTDEGFRVIELWESEEAWRRFTARLADPGSPSPHQVLRALSPEHVVYGEREDS